MQSKKVIEKRICCICDSYYQLLYLLGLLSTIDDLKNKKIDLYINEKIIESNQKLIIQIKTNWKIENIFRIKNKKDISMKERAKRLLSPSKFIRERTDNSNIACNNYTSIYLAVPTHFTISLILINKSANIIYYEDGLASYTQDLVKLVYSKLERLIYFFIGKNLNRVYPNTQYLSSPDIYVGNMCSNIKKNVLIDVSCSYREIIKSLFPVNNQKYINKKFIYLTQPLETIKGYSDSTKEIITFIEEKLFSIGNELIIRKHPSDKTNYDNEDIDIDFSSGMWEMLCGDVIDNNTILIAYFSTAQFTPHILYEKMPRIIFLYKLFPKNFDAEYKLEMEKTIALLSKKYGDSNRIFVPNTIDELENQIQKLKKL